MHRDQLRVSDFAEYIQMYSVLSLTVMNEINDKQIALFISLISVAIAQRIQQLRGLSRFSLPPLTRLTRPPLAERHGEGGREQEGGRKRERRGGGRGKEGGRRMEGEEGKKKEGWLERRTIFSECWLQ